MWVEENRAQRFLRRCVCAVCALMFAFFILVFLLSDQGPAGYRLAWAAALICLLAGAAWLCRHFATFVAKHFSLLVGGAALVFFAAAVVFATMLRFEPIYDLEAIYRGGEGWGIYGELMRFTSHTFDPNYFYRWHNNLGGAAFLAIYFKLVHALGGTDLFLAASCLNAFLAALCIFVTAHAGRKLGGETVGIVAGLCLLCTPPMWFSAAVFYTDVRAGTERAVEKRGVVFACRAVHRPWRDGKTYRGNCGNCGHTDCILAVQTQTGGCVCAMHRIVCRHVSDCA